jgi:hypothetical protein
MIKHPHLKLSKFDVHMRLCLLIIEFEWRFANQDLMNVMGIIYSQYWLNFQAKETFQGHLVLLKAQFCFEKFIDLENEQVKITTLLDESKLDLATSLFKITMQSNHATTALEPPLVCNPIT